MLPVRPDHSPGQMFAVTWIGADGAEWTRLIGAESPEDAARIVASLDNLHHRRGVDVRRCEPVQTFALEVVVSGGS